MPKFKKAKTICITSTKGGVGKTTVTLNLAAVYSLLNKKVLIIDLDLYSGGIALSLNVNIDKTVFNIVDDMMNNRFRSILDYTTKYNENIDIIPSPKDPRQAMKIESKYIDLLLYNAEIKYDVILIDTTHVLNHLNLTIMDRSYNNLFIITNDAVALKNTKSLIAIFNDNLIDNYKILYNESIDIFRNYFSLFDMKSIIKANIDYTLSKNFYTKSIDNYLIAGKIPFLDTKFQKTHKKDLENLKKMANDLIADTKKKKVKDNV